ncbi:MAG: disulfide bond formation protein DsbA [Alphaproteobacteria bacterium HGW-Alphaproteobacteria-17]|nr:MAG: disulfide bond formation protein DsbA [Alphaproteobacteria bacterium HGW-Alphaproteobacteria-17]
MNRHFGVVLTGLHFIGAFAAGVALYSSSVASEPAAKVAAAPTDIFVRPHSPIIGSKTAPVTIVEFFDPSCEACRAFYPVVKQILAAYPKDVRLVVRYLPLHQGAAEAIGILQAARAQGVLEPVLEALLEAQPEWHNGDMTGAWSAAEMAGLDVAKAKAMPTAAANAIMEADIADANKLRVKGTPSFFVNGKPLAEFAPEPLYAQVRAEVEAGRR